MYQKPRTRAKSYDNTPIQRIDQGVVSRWQDNDASFYAAAGLLKSTNSIRRNSRMKKDIAVLEHRLTTGWHIMVCGRRNRGGYHRTGGENDGSSPVVQSTVKSYSYGSRGGRRGRASKAA